CLVRMSGHFNVETRKGRSTYLGGDTSSAPAVCFPPTNYIRSQVHAPAPKGRDVFWVRRKVFPSPDLLLVNAAHPRDIGAKREVIGVNHQGFARHRQSE